MKTGKITLVIFSVLALVLSACGNPAGVGGGSGGSGNGLQRYGTVPAWKMQENAIGYVPAPNPAGGAPKNLPVLFADRDVDGFNYYTIYMGEIVNAPIGYRTAVYYDGTLPQTVGLSKSVITASSVSNAVITAVEETTFSSSTTVKNKEINAGFAVGFFSAGAKAQLTETIVNSTTTKKSVTDTFASAQAEIEKVTDTLSFTIGLHNEKPGYYRYVLFGTTDVYLSVKLNADNSQVLESEVSVCARPESYFYAVDYNASGAFGRTGSGELLSMPTDFSSLPILPERPEMFVTVGTEEAGQMAYSKDGITWTNITVGSNSWRNVTYGGGKWVAVGNYGAMAHSSDGIHWTTITVGPTDNNWRGIAYANGKWVAVGGTVNGRSNPSGIFFITEEKGYIASSTDAIMWTTKSMGTTAWNNVAYGNGRWVAVGSQWSSTNNMAHSSDGINWTTISVNGGSGALGIWMSVSYGSGLWVASGYAGRMAYSNDGINWTSITVGYTSGWSYWYDVGYGNGKWVAVGESGRTAYSTNGITWTLIPEGSSAWLGVTYANGKWVAVGYSGWIAHSSDGTSWTRSVVNASANWQGVTYGGY